MKNFHYPERMHNFHIGGGDEEKKGNGKQADPVTDPNDLGADGARFGEGRDPVEDDVL